LNDDIIKTIEKKCTYLCELIDIMKTSNVESCEIDLANNHLKIFCDIFYEQQEKTMKSITYLFLRLKLSDTLCFDDDNFTHMYKNINMHNFF
jgi:hypothetical protein